MKKVAVILSLLVVTSSLFAQVCNPDPNCTTFGFCPDSATGLAPAHPGVPYSEVITVNMPTDTTMNFPGVGIVTLTINTFRIDSMEGLPSALSYACEGGSCVFPGGSSGCIVITGNPGFSMPDQNPLTIFATMNVTHQLLGTFDAPQNIITQYSIDGNSPIDVITGTVYRDENGNCNQDVGEYGVAGRIVTASPGNNYAYTDASGNYSITSDDIGIYTVSHSPQLYWGGLCPQPSQTYTVDIDTTNLVISNINFGDTAFYDITDLRVTLTNLTPARPGFPVIYHISLSNLGTTAQSGTLNLQHDSFLNYNTSNPAETAYNSVDNTISWDFTALVPGATLNYSANFTLSQTTPLNTILNSSAWLSPLAADVTPEDNLDSLNQVVQGSFDPNDKAVLPSGIITDFQVSQQIYLTYQIRFQNTGTDTAFTVVVRDTISPKLSMETFEVLSSSHPVVTTYTNSAREVVWTFNNILLPDSNVNESGSHGFVKYRIRVNNDLNLGEQIPNTAYIYFDFNQPVVTNTVITSVALHPGFDENSAQQILLNIFPNPNNGILTLESNLTSHGIVRTEVRSLFGQLVFAHDENAAKGQYRKTINMDLAKGIYLLTLETVEGRITKKIEVVK